MERSEHGNSSDTNTDCPFQLLCILKLHTYTRVQVSIDICGVDHPSRKRRFEVVYNLLSTRYNSRIRVQTSADEVTRISPVVSPFPSAGRWEREVWDMFGVSSINHPDLRRISTDYGFEGHPLRKDLPTPTSSWSLQLQVVFMSAKKADSFSIERKKKKRKKYKNITEARNHTA
ncbi:unnamed protein product [Lactuca virosa]|uniref:NADH dehydrogenase [ubiquinone] iron-sulfur protein 3 n=1 Tax=Lactuca virosa TaxID=75947 RepID=A0AAU9M8P5_9ASTR|nr:unnamed protein product [Lactuca virosa]